MKLVKVLACFFTVVNAEIVFDLPTSYKGNNGQLSGRIYNGKYANNGQFPYQASLKIVRSPDESTQCGGALISTKHILTSGTCAKDADYIEVLLGTAKNFLVEPTGRMITISRENIKVHEEFNPSTAENDIALLTLPEEIVETSAIRPVNLGELDDSYFGQSASFAGWGKTTFLEVSSKLTYIEPVIMNNEDCESFYSGKIKSSHICVSTDSTHGSPCRGDSGGPLVVNHLGEPLLAGIYSFRCKGDCDNGCPAGFTKVSSYLDWIQQNK